MSSRTVRTIANRTVDSIAIVRMSVGCKPLKLSSLIRQILDEVERESKTPHGVHLPVRRIVAQLNSVAKAIKESQPSHQCPYCNGRGCKACKNYGKVPKIIFDAAPAELKE